MKNTIIISPSGNLYGSEYVLLDFLKNTKKKYFVFIKSRGSFYKKTKNETNHIIQPFSSEKRLYLKLILFLFFRFSVKTVYVNEGGHIRYIKFLAKLFRNRRFIVHVRIKEDTNEARLGALQKNIILISISKYISSFLKPKYKPILIYDPYNVSEKSPSTIKDRKFNISIIGRVTKTKQLDNIFPILSFLKNENKICFNFWGNYYESDEWFIAFKKKTANYSDFIFNFKGFNENKEQIYLNTNLVIHLNTVEALGRIIFEAIDFNTPIITFNEGGTGELMQALGLNGLVIKKENAWGENFAKKISNIVSNEDYTQKIMFAKKIIETDFSPKNYTDKIESLFI